MESGSPEVSPLSPRPANRRKVLVLFGVLLGLWIALVIFAFASNTNHYSEALVELWGYRTGQFIVRLIAASFVPIVASYISKKAWAWGDVILWSGIGCVLAWTVL